ncbi:MAG: ribbon-helix-helix protein, CopG family [Deltaproteobacteria bacterium]|nr:ribbon-helix-helix protein, CopG family [Deltaproteobacteria bacterium]
MGDQKEQIVVRIPAGLKEALKEMAIVSDRTLSQQVRRALKQHLRESTRTDRAK